jgi:hypothetical protein
MGSKRRVILWSVSEAMQPKESGEFSALLTVLFWMVLPLALLTCLIWFS